MFCLYLWFCYRETPDGANYVCPSVKVAVEMLSELPLAETIEQIFVVGGSGVYKVIHLIHKGA